MPCYVLPATWEPQLWPQGTMPVCALHPLHKVSHILLAGVLQQSERRLLRKRALRHFLYVCSCFTAAAWHGAM